MVLSSREIGDIFAQKHIFIKKVKRWDVGFTHNVYDIDGQYILKEYSKVSAFKQELVFYTFFASTLPVPRTLFSGISKKKAMFMVYNKIPGCNLYEVWDQFTDTQRKKVINKICAMMGTINRTPLRTLPKTLRSHLDIDWQAERTSAILNAIKKVRKQKILPLKTCEKIRAFVKENKRVLKEQRIGLVYKDMHFDNIIVYKTKISGILDFESIAVASIDWQLDTIRRMMFYPKIYAAKKYECLIRKKNYVQLLNWYRQYYPELFDFKDLDFRLRLYALEYDLNLLLEFPGSTSLRRRLFKSIAFPV